MGVVIALSRSGELLPLFWTDVSLAENAPQGADGDFVLSWDDGGIDRVA